jgi:hypothetical protein
LALSHVLRRLQKLAAKPPLFVPPLLRYGVLNGRGSQNTTRLRLEVMKVPNALPLLTVWPSLSRSQQKQLLTQAHRALRVWAQFGFTHGDISPRNILLGLSSGQIHFIDWVLNLNSLEGTPLFWGGAPRSPASDQLSLEKTFAWLGLVDCAMLNSCHRQRVNSFGSCVSSR